jgi:hypothetical protein
MTIPAFQRREGRAGHDERRSPGQTFAGVLGELEAARAHVEALEARPRARCRVSQVRTTLGCLITSADEVLALLLQRPTRALIGLPLATLIAAPERKHFAARAKALMDGPDGAEWETRMIAPGALLGVPVAITLERAAGGIFNWYLRDLSELRRAQAHVMQLEQMASSF